MIAALVLPEEYSDWASKRLSDYQGFHTLDLNYYEVFYAIKRKTSDRFSAKDAEQTFKQVTELLNLHTVYNFSEVITNAMSLALELNITVYYAAFLALAEKIDTSLLTLDRKFAYKLQDTKYADIIECP